MVPFNLTFISKEMEKEYSLLKSRSKVEFYQAALFFWLAFLISFSITLILDKQLLEGSIYSGITFLIVIMLLFKKYLRKCNQYLLFVITLMLNLSTLLYAILQINQGSSSLQLLRGWSFASAQLVVVDQFPKFQQKAFFIILCFGLRYGLLGYYDQTIFVPDIIIRHILTDLFIIYIFFNIEKKERYLFSNFYEYRDELLKFKDLLENYLPQCVTILDANTKESLFSNKAFLNLLQSQSTSNELQKGLACLQLKVETARLLDDAEDILSLIKKEKSGDIYIQDLINSNLFGQKVFAINAFWILQENQRNSFDIIFKPIKWDGEEAVAVIFNDTTYQENILALKIADKNKDIVLATISHELRTPLNGIVGILQIIQSKINIPEILEYLDLCKDNAILLLNLVNSILDLQQLRQGKLEIHIVKVNIPKFLRDILRLFQFQSTEKKIYLDLKIEKNVPDEIYTDEGRVRQILINLIGNALKFTLKGGITVEVTRSPDDNESLIIAVIDTGIGIKNEDKSKLFKMYGKLTETENINKNGVGLGLTISDTLARSLNANTGKDGIKLESRIGIGSKFWFKMPKIYNNFGDPNSLIPNMGMNLGSNEEEMKDMIPSEFDLSKGNSDHQKDKTFSSEIQTKMFHHSFRNNLSFEFLKRSSAENFLLQEVNHDISKPKLLPKRFCQSSYEITKKPFSKLHADKGYLLIVDDNSFNIMVARNFAEVLGYSVETAFNGKEAIEKMKESVITGEIYDLILMDCQMPIMDGFEATKILKQMMINKQIPETPIIALTANNSKDDIQRCINIGMIDHLNKPLLLGDLKKVISNLKKRSL